MFLKYDKSQNAVFCVNNSRLKVLELKTRGSLLQLAERADLKSAQYGFESHRSYNEHQHLVFVIIHLKNWPVHHARPKVVTPRQHKTTQQTLISLLGGFFLWPNSPCLHKNRFLDY